MSQQLVIGLPKGSLEQATFELFAKAGYVMTLSRRSYYPSVDDPELQPVLLRPQEMPRYVEGGNLDCGLTGYDWILENNADVVEICELEYSKATDNPVRWVLAVHEDSAYQSVQDLEGKRIATEAVNLTRRFLASKGVTAEVEFSWGATEVKCPKLVDAIVELTETGSSLRANRLRVIEVVAESSTRFIANKAAWNDSWKRRKMEHLAMLLQGALLARKKVGLKLNVAVRDADAVIPLLPCLKEPTVSPLRDKDWLAVEVVVDEKVVRDLIPQLKGAGARDIIEYPLNKVIP
ncbi:MAG: ATP phosphoribosyltransferase [bacterium]|nr:ATP phosphoribosyltransferase [bacterium]